MHAKGKLRAQGRTSRALRWAAAQEAHTEERSWVAAARSLPHPNVNSCMISRIGDVALDCCCPPSCSVHRLLLSLSCSRSRPAKALGQHAALRVYPCAHGERRACKTETTGRFISPCTRAEVQGRRCTCKNRRGQAWRGFTRQCFVASPVPRTTSPTARDLGPAVHGRLQQAAGGKRQGSAVSTCKGGHALSQPQAPC